MISTNLEMENVRVEWISMHQLGERWIQAIAEDDLDKLTQFCIPAISSTLLTPNHLDTFHNSSDLVAKYHDWFDDYTNFHLEGNRVAQVGERLGIFYRLLLQNQGDWYMIEQQLYCNLKNGRVEKVRLLCSGFQPVGTNEEVKFAYSPKAGEQDPERDDLLEFHSESAEAGGTCALLTPAIKLKLREMQSGQILEVRVDDPSARGDIEAWSRLSGNKLLKMVEEGDQELRFFVEKK
jgi:TusA-related sulfurtransferase